jgi:hypothetical protein
VEGAGVGVEGAGVGVERAGKDHCNVFAGVGVEEVGVLSSLNVSIS